MTFEQSLAEAVSINDNISLWWLWHAYMRRLRQEDDPSWWPADGRVNGQGCCK